MQILNTSNDRILLSVRSEYLCALDFHVAEVQKIADLDAVVRASKRFDFAILCYTLTRDQKLRFCQQISSLFPHTQIIELYLNAAPVTGQIMLEASELPEFLTYLVRQRLREPLEVPFRNTYCVENHSQLRAN